MKLNVVLSLALCAVLAGCGTAPSNSTANGSSPSGKNSSADTQQLPLPAWSLTEAYQANATAFDAKYKGKIVTVAGEVDSVGVNAEGKAYIHFQGKSKGSFVQCTFTDSERATVAAMRQGQTLTVSGRIDGVTAGDVLISNCSIVKDGQTQAGATTPQEIMTPLPEPNEKKNTDLGKSLAGKWNNKETSAGWEFKSGGKFVQMTPLGIPMTGSYKVNDSESVTLSYDPRDKKSEAPAPLKVKISVTGDSMTLNDGQRVYTYKKETK